MADPLSLINIPPELCSIVLESLSSDDVISLSLVSRSFYDYFTSDELCRFTHKLYFPYSSENLNGERTKAGFDAAYLRTLRWKQERPSTVDVVDQVADGSTGLMDGFLVDHKQGLLVYQRSRGVVVLKDLNCPRHAGAAADMIIDLHKELGECIMARSENLVLKDGESIRMRTNRGMLLVIGEAHIHPVSQLDISSRNGQGLGILSSFWNWARGVPATRPRRIFQSPHTLCAVFSTRSHDRGKLLHVWVERDSYMSQAALNEFYAISEFDILEQRLEGFIFPKAKRSSINSLLPFIGPSPSLSRHSGHHFTIKKKTLYPQLSTFAISSDTRGKVFYLGFLPPNADRRPVVEVHMLPQFNPSENTWSDPSIIKRVSLRSLAQHLGSLNGNILNSSYWIDFEVGTTVKRLKNLRYHNSNRSTKLDEDVVRLRLRGDFYIKGVTDQCETINKVTWDITARPSPIPPSTITEWRQGKEWASEIDDCAQVSPYANQDGDMCLEDIYPRPTYYTHARDRKKLLAELEVLPAGIDPDHLEKGGELVSHTPYLWIQDGDGSKIACAIYSSVVSTIVSKPCSHDGDDDDDDVTNPYKAVESHSEPGLKVIYPNVPGKNDKAFVPAGKYLRPRYGVFLETGRKITVSNRKQAVEADTSSFELPLPGYDDGRCKILTSMDQGDKRYWVYGKETETKRKGEASAVGAGDKIVIVRFD